MNAVSSHGHVLVVPRVARPADSDESATLTRRVEIIKTVTELEPNHIELLCHMRKVGDAVLTARARAQSGEDASPRTIKEHNHPIYPQFSFVFHRPPFNSIDHLHLHCIAQTPGRTLIDMVKYPTFDTPWCLTLSTVLSSLQKRKELDIE